MVYEVRRYRSLKEFENEGHSDLLVWETDEVLSAEQVRPCGKLITIVGDDRTVEIPDGIETLGYSFLLTYYWGGWNCGVDTVIIPASVKTIEEGAFAGSDVTEVIIAPDSPCGIVKDGGVYTKDGKTLLWILEGNDEDEDGEEQYRIPDGVTRVGKNFLAYDSMGRIVFPQSVTEIGYDELGGALLEDVMFVAPKGSYAIEYAKQYGIDFEEV